MEGATRRGRGRPHVRHGGSGREGLRLRHPRVVPSCRSSCATRPAAHSRTRWSGTGRRCGRCTGAAPASGTSSPAHATARCAHRPPHAPCAVCPSHHATGLVFQQRCRLTLQKADIKRCKGRRMAAAQVRLWDIRTSGCVHIFDQHDTRSGARSGPARRAAPCTLQRALEWQTTRESSPCSASGQAGIHGSSRPAHFVH